MSYRNVAIASAVAIALYYSSQEEHSPSTIVAPSEKDRDTYFKTKRGLWLYTKTCLPSNNKSPIGLIFLVHGFGEHIERKGYDYLTSLLTDQGFVVVAAEHQGHGRSSGDKGYFPKFTHLSEDLIDFVIFKKKQFPGLNVFLWGHSMGGAISILAARSRGDLFKGIVLSSPLVKLPDEKLSLVNKLLAPIISAIGPRLLFPESIDPILISRNLKAVEDYKNDPLIGHGWVRCRAAAEILQISEFIQSHMHELLVPLIVIHGTGDKICDIKGSEIIMSKSNSDDKTFIKCEGLFHEIYEDQERDLYVPKVVQWIVSKNSVTSKI